MSEITISSDYLYLMMSMLAFVVILNFLTVLVFQRVSKYGHLAFLPATLLATIIGLVGVYHAFTAPTRQHPATFVDGVTWYYKPESISLAKTQWLIFLGVCLAALLLLIGVAVIRAIFARFAAIHSRIESLDGSKREDDDNGGGGDDPSDDDLPPGEDHGVSLDEEWARFCPTP